MLQKLRSSFRAAFSAHAGSTQKARGFTLIEIAIVLVVIGILLSGGLLAISPIVQSAQTNETRQKMATAENALLAYMIANGCLPCPSPRGLATGAAGSGLNQNGGGTYTGCNTTVVCTSGGVGTIPWITLGLSEAAATDAWGQRFTYAVDPNLTDSSSMQRSSTGAFPTFVSTIALENVDGTAIAGYTAISYVLISHGRDGSFGEAQQTGTTAGDKYGQAAGNTGVGQHENGNGNLTFAIGLTNSTSSVQHFDDIVSFKSFQPLIISCGAGSCGNPS